jgi:hypothetical protein
MKIFIKDIKERTLSANSRVNCRRTTSGALELNLILKKKTLKYNKILLN